MTKPVIINGSKIAKKIRLNVKNEVQKKHLNPFLAVIFVHTGNHVSDKANQLYVDMKARMAKKLGIKSKTYVYKSNVSQSTILSKVQDLNQDEKVKGILVQLPLPKQIDEQEVESLISPSKDVDGVNPTNIGKLATDVPRKNSFYPVGCTPSGIMKMIDYYCLHKTDNQILLNKKHWSKQQVLHKFYEGKKVVVLGKSNIVGRPLALMLINRGCEVSILNHIFGIDSGLSKYTENADIIISATGCYDTITPDNIGNNHPIFIDAGENTDPHTNKLCGDISSDAKKEAIAYSPVPHGVGPMCVAMVMDNMLHLTENEL